MVSWHKYLLKIILLPSTFTSLLPTASPIASASLSSVPIYTWWKPHCWTKAQIFLLFQFILYSAADMWQISVTPFSPIWSLFFGYFPFPDFSFTSHICGKKEGTFFNASARPFSLTESSFFKIKWRELYKGPWSHGLKYNILISVHLYVLVQLQCNTHMCVIACLLKNFQCLY